MGTEGLVVQLFFLQLHVEYKENFFMNFFFGLISDFLVQILVNMYVLVEKPFYS